jgi:serine/threonine protein kinase
MFQKDEQALINDILEVRDNLGSTRTAVVQSVKCRRILLARKTITCSKQTMTKEEAITEVSHLTRLNHAHILRIIGTYVKGRELSILLYPVAQYNLEGFIEHFQHGTDDGYARLDMYLASQKFYPCLSSGVRYIHSHLTKHMDIKPQNILIFEWNKRRPYPLIADFGIARSYRTQDEIETDGFTSFTKKYAAPEVVRQDLRGLPADIFSLGCVFLEIYSAIQPTGLARVDDTIHALLNRNVRGDASYQANAEELQYFLLKRINRKDDSMVKEEILSLIVTMLNVKSQERPTAEDLVAFFGELDCCMGGSIQLQAMGQVE